MRTTTRIGRTASRSSAFSGWSSSSVLQSVHPSWNITALLRGITSLPSQTGLPKIEKTSLKESLLPPLLHLDSHAAICTTALAKRTVSSFLANSWTSAPVNCVPFSCGTRRWPPKCVSPTLHHSCNVALASSTSLSTGKSSWRMSACAVILSLSSVQAAIDFRFGPRRSSVIPGNASSSSEFIANDSAIVCRVCSCLALITAMMTPSCRCIPSLQSVAKANSVMGRVFFRERALEKVEKARHLLHTFKCKPASLSMAAKMSFTKAAHSGLWVDKLSNPEVMINLRSVANSSGTPLTTRGGARGVNNVSSSGGPGLDVTDAQVFCFRRGDAQVLELVQPVPAAAAAACRRLPRPPPFGMLSRPNRTRGLSGAADEVRGDNGACSF
mmetsp:Transcript_2061/g.3789  ORF Transcript_2061/g.3789 Transcript_2061/m.3789 type:complete len:384 (-) Transcript_2061:92-1243(-)